MPSTGALLPSEAAQPERADEHPRDQRLLPRLRSRPRHRRRHRRRRAGGALHPQEARRRASRSTPIAYCLQRGGVGADGIDAVVFYDKPITTFVRLLKTYLRVGPRGFRSFPPAMPAWTREKLWIPYEIERGLRASATPMPKNLWFTEHHESHAACAFFPSPFEQRGDPHLRRGGGVGDEQRRRRAREPHRAAAPAQLPALARPPLLGVHLLLRVPGELGRVQADGPRALRRAAVRRPHPRPPRRPARRRLVPHGHELLRLPLGAHDDQPALRRAVRRSAPGAGVGDHPARDRPGRARSRWSPRRSCSAWRVPPPRSTGERNACLAGGVALNCVANGGCCAKARSRTSGSSPPPATPVARSAPRSTAGTRSSATPRAPTASTTACRARTSGRASPPTRSRPGSTSAGYPYERLTGRRTRRADRRAVADGDVVGLLQGRMEFGPRALGHRSIIGDPRSPAMQSIMNLKIKYRESFRPFAPAVLDDAGQQVLRPRAGHRVALHAARGRRASRSSASRTEHDHERSADLRTWVNEVRSRSRRSPTSTTRRACRPSRARRAPSFHAILEAFDRSPAARC